MTQLPIIDLRAPEREIARQIADACRPHGFFYAVGHDVDGALALRLERLVSAGWRADVASAFTRRSMVRKSGLYVTGRFVELG